MAAGSDDCSAYEKFESGILNRHALLYASILAPCVFEVSLRVSLIHNSIEWDAYHFLVTKCFVNKWQAVGGDVGMLWGLGCGSEPVLANSNIYRLVLAKRYLAPCK